VGKTEKAKEKMKYVSRKEMQKIDSEAIANHNIPSLLLMENAGKAIADEVRKKYTPACPIFVICGKGKNGGDGLVAARICCDYGHEVKVLLTFLSSSLDTKSDTAINLQKVKQRSKIDVIDNCSKDIFTELLTQTVEQVKQKNAKGCLTAIFIPFVLFIPIGTKVVLIDSILGIGLNKQVTGNIHDMIVEINNHYKDLDIIAADIPSGLDPDTGEPRPVAVKCNKTVTMGLPKIGFKNRASKMYTGEIVVADIGFPKQLLQ